MYLPFGLLLFAQPARLDLLTAPLDHPPNLPHHLPLFLLLLLPHERLVLGQRVGIHTRIHLRESLNDGEDGNVQGISKSVLDCGGELVGGEVGRRGGG